ncbi:259_t:CDS:2, partial [Dentiscutata heterogama]
FESGTSANTCNAVTTSASIGFGNTNIDTLELSAVFWTKVKSSQFTGVQFNNLGSGSGFGTQNTNPTGFRLAANPQTSTQFGFAAGSFSQPSVSST